MYGNISGIGFSWTVGSDGWTVFNPSLTSRIVYVSSSVGNNTWSGLLPEPNAGLTDGPVATVSVGAGIVRSGFPDWLLFRNGDTWTSQATMAGAKNGRSAKEPMVIGSYNSTVSPSTVRPLFIQTDPTAPFASFIQANGQNLAFVGLHLYGSCFDPNSANFLGATVIGDTTSGSNVITNIASVPGNIVAGMGVWGTGVNNFTIAAAGVGANSLTLNTGQNASFNATQIPIQVMTRNTASGMQFDGVYNTLIIEDCQFDYSIVSTTINTLINPTPVNLYMRRCISNNPYAVSAGANAFVSNDLTLTPTDQVQFYQCVLNHGGWNETVWPGGANIFTHSVYLHDPSPPYNLTENIIANDASGPQHRDGGTDTNNLVIGNPISLFGVPETSPWTVSNNVFTNGRDLTAGYRSATAAVSSGTVLSVDGMAFSPLFSSATGQPVTGTAVTNLSNPGSVSGTISSVNTTGKSVNISNTISAGQRGDGVQIGDKIQFWNSGYALGLQLLQVGTYISAGSAHVGAFFEYAGPSNANVSISSASPAIVTETAGVAQTRPAGEPFQFTAGTLPTGLSLSTTYYSLDTGTTYRIATTAGGSPINTTGSAATGVSRTGSRLFFFNAPLQANWPTIYVPPFANVGSKIQVVSGSLQAGAFPSGSTTVASIAADSTSLITTDGSLAAFSGAGQATFLFDAPSSPNVPTARLGPGNVFSNAKTNASHTSGAITIEAGCSGIDASGNYIYNWDMVNTNNNVIDGNTDPTYSSTNTITQSLNVINLNTTAGPHYYPKASIEAYDAMLQNNQFTASITANGTGLGTLTITSGIGPQVGDTIFDLNFAGLVPQYTYVLSGSGSTFLVAQRYGSIGSNVASTTMISGSSGHFIAQASLNSHAGGWNTAYTAPVANNFIRTAMGLPTI